MYSSTIITMYNINLEGIPVVFSFLVVLNFGS